QDAEERRGIAIAILVSVLFHLLLIALVVLFLAMQGRLHFNTRQEESKPVEMIFVDPQTAPPVYVQTTEDQRTDEVPTDTTFESDKNTKAATEMPANGNMPAPTQEGTNEKTIEFTNQKSSVGTAPRPASPSAASQPQQATPAEQKTEETAEQKTPSKTMTEAQPNNIALLEPPVNKTVREMKPVREATTSAPPQRAAAPAYQPEMKKIRIQGGLSNRGRAGVNAIATPLGRYKKMLTDAIGSRWYYYTQQQMGLLAIGTVQIQFVVNADGSVHKLKVLSNSSNESFATCSLRSIMDAKIPPIPEDMAQSLHAGSLEVDYTFSIY
ncbi:MAG: energy transducer TonB, partial [Chthoniobacterales bacterium]